MIMCLLADQGIQGNILLKFRFFYHLIARNVGAIGISRAFGPLWISSHCRNSTPKTRRAPTTDEGTEQAYSNLSGCFLYRSRTVVIQAIGS